ncbi:MAG: hypothetical protein MK142_15840, partial [Pseudomonadales bacterium]|nr:hypothetical protein [Pseudomonadales bacterium]
ERSFTSRPGDGRTSNAWSAFLTWPTHATEEWDPRAKSPLVYCFLRSRCPGCDEIAIRPGIPFLGVRLHPAMANLLDYVVLGGLLLGLIKFIAWKYGLS